MDVDAFLSEWNNGSQFVHVKTSGSTGAPKPLLVEKARMRASARITCDFLGLKEGDSALLCMSVDYIAGKMMVVRSLERGLRLHTVTPSNRPLRGMTEPFDFIAMVPSQVFETLNQVDEAALLRQTRHLIIGGGAVPAALAVRLRDFPNSVWSTYGMTETLSHIAMRRLNGAEASDWYVPLGGVGVSLKDGCLVINAPQVCPDVLVTNDIAEISGGKFRILGRRDNVICSGGIKIQTEQVEALLQPVMSAPFAITKVADSKFGEAVVLLTVSCDLKAVQTVCERVLPRYWIPKYYLHTDHIPMTETGKPARRKAEFLAASLV
jgi:o-succinylbenzoate---CoA ligase